ncbi:PREDICTED: uncharacterized protein LOC106746457 [Dinoponera quadriceps]|uniref:Odorant receptor n=1 Tax=Dinoponera quadriceps TaxID=609295 RepID=A0A6P3XJX5_DINQU|nr:PREDICTED: uncharacterized protein LOC106746457 [Dinoponera quadriceps]
MKFLRQTSIQYIGEFTKHWLFERQVKHFLERIVMDWNIVDYGEMKILEKYANECHIVSLFIVRYIGFIIIEMLPIILDAVAPMNETRPRQIQYDLELFLDRQQYFFFYVTYECAMLMISYLALAPIFLLLIVLLRHICAIYKIASILIGSTVTKHTLEIPDDRKIREMCRRITRAIYMHRRAIQFIQSMLKLLDKWVLVATAIVILSLSCNLLLLLVAVTVITEVFEILIRLITVFGHFIILFIGNFIAQTVTNHSAEMFTASYNTAWYLSPLPVQKLLLFVMQYSLKDKVLTIGGIYPASLEGFTTLTQLTTNYDYLFVITVLSGIIPCVTCSIFNIYFHINPKKTKHVLEQIMMHWNTADYSDMKILEKYAKECRIVSLIIIVMIITAFFVNIIIEMLPIILDVVLPINESRPRKIQVDFDIFLDKNEYFFVIYECWLLIALSSMVFAVFLLMFMFMRHCCAIYKIASSLKQ